MALSKVTYVDGVTIIGAKNLNDIQDEIIANAGGITALNGDVEALDNDKASVASVAALSGRVLTAEGNITSLQNGKADKSDTYTKAQVDSALSLKADKSDTYTKTEVNEALELKADKSDTYTKATVDAIVQDAIAEAVKESEYSNFEMKSVSGDIIHITDGAGLIPVKDLKIGIDAVQDLHGYDAPWVGGAGKNKAPYFNHNETISDVAISTDDKGVIKLNGTASGSVNVVSPTFTLPAGTYVLSDSATGTFPNTADRTQVLKSADSTLLARIYNTDPAGQEVSFTLEEDTVVFYRIRLNEGSQYSNCTLSPMIRLATVTDATYAPYANICPISGWTGAKVSVNGINQWDEEWEEGRYNSTTGQPESSDAIRSKNYIPVIPSAEYYVKISTGQIRFYYYDDTKNFISSEAKTSGTFTIPSGAKYLKFSTANYGKVYHNDISINYPSTDTDYHAYDGHVYEVTWQTEAGTVYGGTLDATTGELVVTHKYTELGDKNWDYSSANSQFYFVLSDVKTGIPQTDAVPFICSDYAPAPHPSAGQVTNGTIGTGTNGGLSSTTIIVMDTRYSDVASFKAALTASNAHLVYELATPQTYQLTPIEVLTLLGENNIFADTGAIEELIYRISRQA